MYSNPAIWEVFFVPFLAIIKVISYFLKDLDDLNLELKSESIKSQTEESDYIFSKGEKFR